MSVLNLFADWLNGGEYVLKLFDDRLMRGMSVLNMFVGWRNFLLGHEAVC